MRNLLSFLPLFLYIKHNFYPWLLWTFLLNSGFLLIWLWCSFLYFSSCFLCLRFLDLRKYSFYQLWENFGYYFSLVFLHYILFFQTLKIHILGLLKLPNSSLRLCAVLIVFVFFLSTFCWIISIAMSSNSLIFSFAISNILLIYLLYFLSQKL